jgi:hypothetical protein
LTFLIRQRCRPVEMVFTIGGCLRTAPLTVFLIYSAMEIDFNVQFLNLTVSENTGWFNVTGSENKFPHVVFKLNR